MREYRLKRPLCLDVAKALTKLKPKEPLGWFLHAKALRYQGNVEEAYYELVQVPSSYR